MLNYEYRILKHIRKNPNITRKNIIEKFDKFEKYENSISDYVFKDDKNADKSPEPKEEIIASISRSNIPIGMQAGYLDENTSDAQIESNDSLIFFSTNRYFELEVERRRREAWLRWFPYTITTLIAIASVIARFFS